MLTAFVQHSSSYRDPSGFMFEKNGQLYRQVNLVFKEHFDYFINSGCYAALVKKGLLIPHREIKENITQSDTWFTTLLPEKIEHISYPYEWSFDMLKDAALLTLQLAKESLSFGLVLKDATPYNIQWHTGRLLFIDTLSFEKYDETRPWIAYRQFCECFLAPLLLMHYSRLPLQQLFLAYPDGIPIGIAQKLLPWRSRFSLYTYLHIHLHASVSAGNGQETNRKINFTRQKLINLLSSLQALVSRTVAPRPGIWSGYYEEASQRDTYLDQKKRIVRDWVVEFPAIRTAIDFGANEGEFSMLLAQNNIKTTAADFEPFCINKLYHSIKEGKIRTIQPLVLDIALPSPGIGVNNKERFSFTERFQADLGLALALVHHLCIGKSISFSNVAAFFRQVCQYLIIEFVPKEDEKVKMMLRQKTDNYNGYNEENFIAAFQTSFTLIKKAAIDGTNRVLFLMKNNQYPANP